MRKKYCPNGVVLLRKAGDFEPERIDTRELGYVFAFGDFGHVELSRAGMHDAADTLAIDLEAKLRTGFDECCFCFGCAEEGVATAGDVCVVHIVSYLGVVLCVWGELPGG